MHGKIMRKSAKDLQGDIGGAQKEHPNDPKVVDLLDEEARIMKDLGLKKEFMKRIRVLH